MAITAPPASIFKAYDVRGLYGEEMDGETAFLIGRAFARVLARLREKAASDLQVGLGHDMRLSSPEMAERASDGMVAEGVRVLDAGQVRERTEFRRDRHIVVGLCHDGGFARKRIANQREFVRSSHQERIEAVERFESPL